MYSPVRVSIFKILPSATKRGTCTKYPVSTFAGFGKVDENICYEKLKSLVSGASLASKYL